MFGKLATWIALFVTLSGAALSDGSEDMLDVRVLPGWRAADGRHVAGLEVRLKQGWKTYWRSPGDAGIPPRFDWRGSRNLSAVEVTWPTPKQIQQNGYVTIGYDHSIVIPLALTPRTKDQPIALKGALEFGVCRDVCIPVALRVAHLLPAVQAAPDARIVAALAERPFTAEEAGVGQVVCRFSPLDDGLSLEASMDVPALGGREAVVIETANPEIWVAQAKVRRDAGRLVARTDMHHVAGSVFAIDRSELVITVFGRDSAVEIHGCSAR